MLEKPRGWVKGSGAATAHSGGVAVSGVQFGDNYLAAAPPARSAYVKQVEQVAPDALVDRDAELSELAEFCTRETGREWVWWQAPAWSGKSALMATFVLSPPPGVRVVSFFVTARWYGHSDRAAFVNVVLEQLAEVAEQPMPAYLTDDNREAHFLSLLEQAADACRSAGERLVLVVDGLDEDRGVTTDPDSHSIAALLPDRLPGGMRVIVAGRANPPVPLDVPEDHPLRDPGIVRPLSRSRVATVIMDQATRELRRLLRGTPAEQRLLGLVTAAGGGLSSRDLAELTGLPVAEVTDQLETVSGRTFTPRESHWAVGTPLYVLAHEELQVLAAQRLGDDRLEEHRKRIHAWAQDHRGRGWPADTPEYLLRGYFSMLRTTRDLDGMVSFCLDAVRQNRLMELSGGDHTSLTEIATTLEAIKDQDPPDLLAACRLAIRRDHLQRRSSRIPPMLPVLWAASGDVGRGETLARSMTDPYWRAEALGALAVQVARVGELDRARALLTEAERAVHSVTEPHNTAWVLARLARRSVESGLDSTEALIEEAESLARSAPRPFDRANAIAELASTVIDLGDLGRAEALIRSIALPGRQAWPLAELGLATIRDGELTRALELAEEAETFADASTDDSEALATLAVVAAEAGDPDRSRRLSEDARTRTLAASSEQKALMLAMLAQTVADAGGLDHARELAEEAEILARSIADPDSRADAIAEVASAVMRVGELPRAEALIRSIAEPRSRAWPLAELGMTMANAGEMTSARALAEETETLMRSGLDRYGQAVTMARLATMVANTGEADRAHRLAERAELLARSIPEPGRRADALAALADIAIQVRDLDRGRRLTEEAETAVQSIAHADQQDWRRSELAGLMTRLGDLRRAQAQARSIVDAYDQVEALTDLARAAARAGDTDLARDLATDTETLARSIADPHMNAWALKELAKALAEVGDGHHAETVARSITDIEEQATVFAALSKVAADIGDLDHAEALARSAASPHERAVALAALATLVAEAGDPDRARDLNEEAEALAQSLTMAILRAGLLAELAGLATDAPDRARALVKRAEAAAQSIRDVDSRDSVRAELAEVMAQVGDLRDAETLVRSITGSYDQARASAAVATAAARAGDIEHAERLAHAITDPDTQAEVLASMARLSTPDRARRHIAMALSLSEWTVSLEALAKTDPAVLREIADDLLSEADGR